MGFLFGLCYACAGLGDGHWNAIEVMFAMSRFTWTLTGNIVFGNWSGSGWRALLREWTGIRRLLVLEDKDDEVWFGYEV